MNQDAPANLDAVRAAVVEACAEAEGLLARARALRQASEALRLRFEAQRVPWRGSPECYSYDKALQPVAERLYELGGGLFRLCHDQGCIAFDAQAHATRPVNGIGELALGMRRAIAEAGFGAEPPPWQERGHLVAAADPAAGLPPELRDLPSLQWARAQRDAVRLRGRQARYLAAAAVLLLGAAGASVSGIVSGGEGSAGLLFAVGLAAAGWCAAGLLTSGWRRLSRRRLIQRPSMRILADFDRSCS